MDQFGEKRASEQDAEDLRAETTPQEFAEDTVSVVTNKGPPWFETSTGVLLGEEKVKKGMERDREILTRLRSLTRFPSTITWTRRIEENG